MNAFVQMVLYRYQYIFTNMISNSVELTKDLFPLSNYGG